MTSRPALASSFTTREATQLPTGLWLADPTASNVGFSVHHPLAGAFRAVFTRFVARLAVAADGQAALTGAVRADSLAIADSHLASALAAPAFLDTGRHPELRFGSTAIRRVQRHLELDGRLSIKGRTLAIAAVGTFDDAVGLAAIGLELETRVDRRQFGLDGRLPRAYGGWASAHEVRIEIDLALIRRAASASLAARRPTPATDLTACARPAGAQST
jgi:polyisoprenoid-binding protein YceI